MALDWVDGLLIFLGLLGAYAGIVYALYRAGRIGPERSLSLFGPALMVKTRRGRGWLDRVGRFRRFWSRVSDVGLLLAGVAMVVIVGTLIWEGVLVTQIPASAAPSPQEALALPGLNPVIPLGYGLVAIVVGIVLHELAHGIVARSQGVGVRSLGILWFVVPVGAFVEQEEQEMRDAPRRVRGRIAAAGILANFGLAVLFFTVCSLLVSTSVHPNANGAGVEAVLGGSPAANASIAPGDIITSVNGTATPNNQALFDALAKTTGGETIPLTYYSAHLGTSESIRLTLSPSPYTPGRGYLGVGIAPVSTGQFVGILSSPLTSSNGPLAGGVTWIILPLAGLSPIAGPTTSFFHLTGAGAALGSTGFWVTVNLLYWLSWMNLLLGLSNALPLVPLDGGLLYRDFVTSALARLRRGWDAATLDGVAGRLSVLTSLFVVFLLAWQFIAPRL
ncbi:MAG: site-2 protease family protein [Thermoplasmata archaeon]|nr:site-2 protease family protein [Thermoplasmata archaeon]